MTTTKFSNPKTLFDPLPFGFSHVATTESVSKFIFLAGQGGEENNDGKLSADFRVQVRYSINNLRIALASEGLDLNSIVKVTTLVVDHDREKHRILTEEFEKAWPEKNFPVNTLIPVARLAQEHMQVEIDAIAIV
jgi:enamine deaminase RidA (YjgF/YER057c/UK114 family)